MRSDEYGREEIELPESSEGKETVMSKGENSRSAIAGRESLAGSSDIVSIAGADADASNGMSTISSVKAPSSAGPDALRLIPHSSPNACGVAGMMLKVGRCSSATSPGDRPGANLPGADGVSNRLDIRGGRLANCVSPRRSEVGRYGLGGARDWMLDMYAAGGVVTCAAAIGTA